MANKLWGDVKKSLQDLSNIAAEKGKVFSKAAADKAEELTRTGKLKLDVLQVNRDIERNFTELGGKVYELKADGQLDTLEDATDVQAIFDKIQVLEEKKAALESKLKKAAREEGEAEEATAEPASPDVAESAEPETDEDSEETATP